MSETGTDPVRCLAHGCTKADQCLRHVVIRQKQPPADDAAVMNNACNSDGPGFVPINAEITGRASGPG